MRERRLVVVFLPVLAREIKAGVECTFLPIIF